MLLNGTIYDAGDASGGSYTNDNKLRRDGWPMFVADVSRGQCLDRLEDLRIACLEAGNLPGLRQSVSRGETFALPRCLNFARSHGLTRGIFVTGSGYVAKGFRYLMVGKHHHLHVDLWLVISRFLGGFSLSLVKTESHRQASTIDLNSGDDPCSFLAKKVADGLAEYAASREALSFLLNGPKVLRARSGDTFPPRGVTQSRKIPKRSATELAARVMGKAQR